MENGDHGLSLYQAKALSNALGFSLDSLPFEISDNHKHKIELFEKYKRQKLEQLKRKVSEMEAELENET